MDFQPDGRFERLLRIVVEFEMGLEKGEWLGAGFLPRSFSSQVNSSMLMRDSGTAPSNSKTPRLAHL